MMGSSRSTSANRQSCHLDHLSGVSDNTNGQKLTECELSIYLSTAVQKVPFHEAVFAQLLSASKSTRTVVSVQVVAAQESQQQQRISLSLQLSAEPRPQLA